MLLDHPRVNIHDINVYVYKKMQIVSNKFDNYNNKTRRITTALFDNDNDKENYDYDNNNKFKIATSGILSYRINILNRLQAKSKENASTIIDYLFSMHNEINTSISYKTNQIITLSQLSESCNNDKPFYK